MKVSVCVCVLCTGLNKQQTTLKIMTWMDARCKQNANEKLKRIHQKRIYARTGTSHNKKTRFLSRHTIFHSFIFSLSLYLSSYPKDIHLNATENPYHYNALRFPVYFSFRPTMRRGFAALHLIHFVETFLRKTIAMALLGLVAVL